MGGVHNFSFNFHLLKKEVCRPCVSYISNLIEHKLKFPTSAAVSSDGVAHCLYGFLDGKKLAASNLPFQVFEGFIGTFVVAKVYL